MNSGEIILRVASHSVSYKDNKKIPPRRGHQLVSLLATRNLESMAIDWLDVLKSTHQITAVVWAVPAHSL
jgi:hypothetical protein